MRNRYAQFDFAQNRVLVTGGTRGIGLAIARAFLDANATVAITGTRDARSHAEDHSGLDCCRCDMRDPDNVRALADRFKSLDV